MRLLRLAGDGSTGLEIPNVVPSIQRNLDRRPESGLLSGRGKAQQASLHQRAARCSGIRECAGLHAHRSLTRWHSHAVSDWRALDLCDPSGKGFPDPREDSCATCI